MSGGPAGPSGLEPLPLAPIGSLPMLSFGQGFPEQGVQQQMGHLNLASQVRSADDSVIKSSRGFLKQKYDKE